MKPVLVLFACTLVASTLVLAQGVGSSGAITGTAVDASGAVYVADGENNVIRRIVYQKWPPPTIDIPPSAVTVRVGSPTSFSVTQTVQTMTSAKTLTLDSKSNRILLIAAQFTPPPTPPPAGRRSRGEMVPDSFSILVVGK